MKRTICDSLKNNIIDIIIRQINIKIYAIYIFGSYGTKYQRDDSDIDIAIVTSDKCSISDRYKLKQKLSDDLKIDVDLTVVSDYKSNLMINILSYGYLIYESDDYNIIFDDIYENLQFEFYFIDNYMEEINKYV